ncbi:hypothetical protein [Rhodothermus marinus]|nr:hypothetical protein [Rhodothermus marinus]
MVVLVPPRTVALIACPRANASDPTATGGLAYEALQRKAVRAS